MAIEKSQLVSSGDGSRRRKYTIMNPRDFLIPSGQNGSTVDPVVLDGHCRALGISILDCTGIDASTNMTAQIAFDNEATTGLAALYAENDPGTQWEATSIPATGTCAFVLSNVRGIVRIRFVLSKVTTANVAIKVYGLDGVS